MRALTIRYPHIGNILHDGKRLENRNEPPPQDVTGARVALHAAKSPAGELSSHIVATARVVGWSDWRGHGRGLDRADPQLVPTLTSTTRTAAVAGMAARALDLDDEQVRRAIDLCGGWEEYALLGDQMRWRLYDHDVWIYLTDLVRLDPPVPVARGWLGWWHLAADVREAVQGAEATGRLGGSK